MTIGPATEPPSSPDAVPFAFADPEANDARLASDGFGWLAALLPAPMPLTCPRCRRPMRLGAVPLLWQCTPCDTPPPTRRTA
jgi:hypothetical protein